MKKVYVKFNTISPVSHLTPPNKDTRMTATQRMIKLVIEKQNGKKEVQNVPVVSGGSLRGKNRRAFITKVLGELGYYKDNLLVGLSQEVFEALIAGGRQAGKSERFPQVEKYISIYNDLPFFGLFGGVVYKAFFPGRLSVGFAIPMVEETRHLFIGMDSPYADENMPGISALIDALGNRHTYTRRKVENIAVLDEVDFSDIASLLRDANFDEAAEALENDMANYNDKLAAGDEDNPKLDLKEFKKAIESNDALRQHMVAMLKISKPSEQTAAKIVGKLINMYNLQMLYEVPNPIPAGINLHSYIAMTPGLGDDRLMAATFDAFIETIAESRYIGGIHNKGYGQVITEVKTENGKNFGETSDAEYFWTWLKENKKQIRAALENLEKYLFTGQKVS